MRLLDEQYTRTPFYGTRKMSAWLHTQGYPVDRKRVRRLLRLMGLEAIYPKPKTSVLDPKSWLMANFGEKVRREKQAVIRKPLPISGAFHCPLAFLSRFTKLSHEPLIW